MVPQGRCREHVGDVAADGRSCMALTGPTGESDPTMSMADPTMSIDRRRRRERHWLIVVASLGVVFSIVVWSIARHDRLQASRHAFSEIATATAAAMALDIDRHIGVADDLAALFASSNDVSADEFERYVVSARRRAPAISALAWYRGQIVSPLREGPPIPGEMLPHDVDLMAARLERQVLVQARDVAGPEDETGQLSSGPPVEPSVMTRLVERALFSGATAVSSTNGSGLALPSTLFISPSPASRMDHTCACSAAVWSRVMASPSSFRVMSCSSLSNLSATSS